MDFVIALGILLLGLLPLWIIVGSSYAESKKYISSYRPLTKEEEENFDSN